jgi:hypothetical protein
MYAFIYKHTNTHTHTHIYINPSRPSYHWKGGCVLRSSGLQWHHPSHGRWWVILLDYWLTNLCSNIPTDWIFALEYPYRLNICTRMSSLAGYFVLEYSYWRNICTGISYWLNFLYWNILTDWIFCTRMPLLAGYFVLEYSYWLNILYWNILIGWMFCKIFSR